MLQQDAVERGFGRCIARLNAARRLVSIGQCSWVNGASIAIKVAL
jgi:hypothetical protein